jgi:hypothetical protein
MCNEKVFTFFRKRVEEQACLRYLALSAKLKYDLLVIYLFCPMGKIQTRRLHHATA